MKNLRYIQYLFLMATMLFSCDSQLSEREERTDDRADGHNENEQTVFLTDLKFKNLDMQVDTIPTKNLSGLVKANGRLEVPPQHEATVTPILGANITSIKVIEGDKIKKGQVLAYISHPDLTQLQTSYIKTNSKLQYLEKEMKRQQRLYDEEVGAGKDYQETLADYNAMKGEVSGFEMQLKQLKLNPDRVKDGKIYEYVPVVSPIDGYIEKVRVKVGQFVDQATEMFLIVNTEHIHADLMVFEKDVHKVKVGQKIVFNVESVPDKQLEAEIYSVGKQFEEKPKAVHVHAEIKKKQDFLVPGMYINGNIFSENTLVKALPEAAIIEDEGRSYIFIASKEDNNGWTFSLQEVRLGIADDGWVAVKLMEPLPNNAKVAMNNAYYLIAEKKKGSTGHHH